MRYKTLKTQDGMLNISNIAIGSAVKMGGLSKRELFELYDMYVDAGGNCIDTARAYGGGIAEQLVGEYIRIRGNRDKVLISTKCCNVAEDGSPRLTRAVMEEELHTSLKTLSVEHIDIYWLHKDDEDTPVEIIVDFMNEVLRCGKIGTFGCSNWHVDRIAAANAYAKQTGQRGFAVSQIQWNLAESKEEYFRQFTSVLMDEKAYGWYLENKMPVFAFSPQAQGFFSKAAAGGLEVLNDMLKKFYVNPNNWVRLERVKALAAERNVPVSVPVLAYLINNKLPCIPVFGTTSKKTLLETLQASDFEMTAEEADALYRIEKGPEYETVL